MRGIGSGILFWFTVRGRMVRDGKVFTTSWSRMATTSASSRNRKPLSKTMWLPRSAPLLCRMGRAFLSGHSYGGAVITEAGTDSSVAGLVYVAAHMPDAGENEADDGNRFPSDLGKSGAIKKTPDGFTYLDPTQFHEYFAPISLRSRPLSWRVAGTQRR